MFLIRKPPLLDESLSSWRQRSGIENGFHRFPHNRKEKIKDPDRLPEEGDIEWMQHALSVDRQSLERLTVDYWIGGAESRLSRKVRWLISQGAGENSNFAGPMFCPLCLREDAIPYYRIAWRFAFVTHCHVHGTALLDRCPQCQERIWPTAAEFKRRKGWCPLHHCSNCRSDLSSFEPSLPSGNFSSIWPALRSKKLPDNIVQASNTHDYLLGLWIISQVLMRQCSDKLRDMLRQSVAPELATGYPKVHKIEQLCVLQRQPVIQAATWLLEYWPERFVETAQRSGLQRHHFVEILPIAPIWLQSVVDKEFTIRRYRGISLNQATEMINHLKSTNPKITKTDVRRAFGISESVMLNDLMGQRRHATQHDLLVMRDIFEELIRTTPSRRTALASVKRDYLIFLLSILFSCTVEAICGFTRAEILSRLQDEQSREGDLYRSLSTRAYELIQEYPWEMKQDGTFRFTSRFGAELKGHSIRSRITLMMAPLDQTLWRSVDVFKFFFSTQPLGRRSRR